MAFGQLHVKAQWHSSLLGLLNGMILVDWSKLIGWHWRLLVEGLHGARRKVLIAPSNGARDGENNLRWWRLGLGFFLSFGRLLFRLRLWFLSGSLVLGNANASSNLNCRRVASFQFGSWFCDGGHDSSEIVEYGKQNAQFVSGKKGAIARREDKWKVLREGCFGARVESCQANSIKDSVGKDNY